MYNAGDIAAFEAARRAAMTSADIGALDALFADDLIWIHANAHANTKSEFLDVINSGRTKYQSIECTDETVRFYGDTALVSGIANIRAHISGEDRHLVNRFTITWAKIGESWKVVNWQSTALPKK